MPVLALNSGRIRPNSPESCVEVVEETTIDFSARAGETASRATKVPITVSSRDITRNPPFGWKITQCSRRAAMLCRDRASMAFAITTRASNGGPMGKNRQGCEKFIILQRHSALAEMYASHVSKAASGQ